jgi:hypothetical protein
MKAVFGLRKSFFLFGILMLFCHRGICDDLKKWHGYDRMRAIENFLDVMYPELQQENGLLTFRTREFNLRGDDLRVSFVKCRVGSGVPAGSVKPTLPNCDVFYESATSEFLALTFRTGTHKFPIYWFEAKGNFFGQREELLEKTKAHPEWSDKERLDSLTEAHPKFGPENRTLFLQTVPVGTVYEFSGCRLILDQAKFDATGVDWYVPGTVGRGRKGHSCQAQFDPFGGRLLAFSQL